MLLVLLAKLLEHSHHLTAKFSCIIELNLQCVQYRTLDVAILFVCLGQCRDRCSYTSGVYSYYSSYFSGRYYYQCNRGSMYYRSCGLNQSYYPGLGRCGSCTVYIYSYIVLMTVRHTENVCSIQINMYTVI